MFKKNIIALSLSAILFSASALADSKQVAVELTTVPFDVLNIKDQDPRYNHNAPLQFALKEQGYFPLTGIMIAQESRNPFTVVEVLHGYLIAKKVTVSKNDIAIVNKLADTNYRYDTLNTYSSNLIRLAIDKSYLLGEYVTNAEISEWVANAPTEGRERVQSNLIKLQKFFATKNEIRDKSDKALSKKLAEVYAQGRDLLKPHLKKNLDVEYYLKSLLYQDEDTRQVSEVMLLNTLSPTDLGEVAAVSEIIVNAMVKLNLPVKINEHIRETVKGADQMPNIDFSGDFTRIYGNTDALAYQLKMLDQIKIEQDKELLNQYKITFISGNEKYSVVGKINKAGRGLEFVLDNYINGQIFYGTIKGDDLTLYADPVSGNELVLQYKRIGKQPISDEIKFNLREYRKLNLELPKYEQPLSGRNVDLSVFKPTSVAAKWLALSENYTVDLKELLKLEKVYSTEHDYGLVLMKSSHSNLDDKVKRFDGETYIDRFVIVDSKSKDYKREALDCDELRSGVGVQQIKLNNGVIGYFSLSDYVSPKSPSFLSATLPYQTGSICMAINFGTGLSYEPEKLSDGVKLFNNIIHEYSMGK